MPCVSSGDHVVRVRTLNVLMQSVMSLELTLLAWTSVLMWLVSLLVLEAVLTLLAWALCFVDLAPLSVGPPLLDRSLTQSLPVAHCRP